MRTASFLFIVIVLATGCYASRDETTALRKEVAQVRQQINEDMRRAQEERRKLEELIEKATKLLARNSADIGAQVERMQQKLDRTSGRTDEQQRNIDELRQNQAKLEVKLEGLSRSDAQSANAQMPEDKEQLYSLAISKFNANDFSESRRLLRNFISRFAQDQRLPQAQLYLGDSYFSEQKFAPAIVEYKIILEQYQQSTQVPDALYKIGMAFYQLKYCNDAQLFFGQLLKKHKNYVYATRAEKALLAIKQNRNNYSFCRP